MEILKLQLDDHFNMGEIRDQKEFRRGRFLIGFKGAPLAILKSILQKAEYFIVLVIS